MVLDTPVTSFLAAWGVPLRLVVVSPRSSPSEASGVSLTWVIRVDVP